MKTNTQRNSYVQGSVVRIEEDPARIFQVVRERDKKLKKETSRPSRLEKKILVSGIVITSVIWMLGILIALMIGGIVYGYTTRAVVPDIPDGYVKEYTVIHMPAGSTVWDEAWKIIDEYDMESIYRTKDLVYEIGEINDINVSNVKYGQAVVIPYLIEDTNE